MKWLVVSPPAIEPSLPPLGALAVRSALRDRGVCAEFLDLNLEFHSWFLTWQSRRDQTIPPHGQMDAMLMSDFDHAQSAELAVRSITGSGELDFGRAVRLLTSLYRAQSVDWYPYQVTLSGVLPGHGGEPDRLLQFISSHRNPVVVCMQRWAPTLAAMGDVVLISVGFESQVVAALALARILKREFGRTVIIGGAVVGLWGRRLAACSSIVGLPDAYVQGPIESCVDQLCGYVNGSISVTNVAGVTAVVDGVIVTTKPSSRSVRSSRIDMTDLPRYWLPEVVLPVDWGRGCYWGNCLFCGIHAGDHVPNGWCRPDLAVIAEQIRNVRAEGARRIVLTTESVHPDDVQHYHQQWMRRPIDAELCCRARPELEFVGLAKMMKSVGFRLVAFGFESCSRRVLDLMNKGTDPEDYFRIIDAFSEVGIDVIGHFMVGYPGETEQEAELTLRFIEQCHSVMRYAVISRFRLDTGSPLHKESDCCVAESDPGLAVTVGHSSRIGMNDEQVMNVWTGARKRLRELYPEPLLGNPLLLDVEIADDITCNGQQIMIRKTVVGVAGDNGHWRRWQGGQPIPAGKVIAALDRDSFRRVTVSGWAGDMIRAVALGPVRAEDLRMVGVSKGASVQECQRVIELLVQERILTTAGR